MTRSPFAWLPFTAAGLSLALACKGSVDTPEQPAAPAPTAAAAATAGTAAPATGSSAATGSQGDAPAKLAEAPKDNGLVSGPASDKIVAAARSIQTDLGCLRGRKFKKDPAVHFQSLTDFRKYVDAQLQKELGGEKGKQLVRTLHALDVVDPSVDVLAQLADAAVGQAAAYYDPETQTFYVVQEMPDMVLNSVMAHELQHALQDQHTTLLKDYLAQGFGSTDMDLATRFLVEGEATLIGHAWMMNDIQSRLPGLKADKLCHLPGARAGDPSFFWPTMREIVADSAKQTRDDVLNPGMLAKLAASSMSEGMAESMEQLKKLPVYFFYSLLLPYNQGGLTVYEQFAASGYDWKAIDQLFAHPPQTTEVVLHPEKLAKGGEAFKALTLDSDPPLEGDAGKAWVSDPPDRLGELMVRIWLIEEGLEERKAIDVAAGWNGDQIRVWYKGETLAFDWKIAWDSDKDLEEFLAALPGTIATQRGLKPEALASIDPKAPKGSVSFGWTDKQGQARHGFVSWANREMRWSDGWDQAPKSP